MIGQNINNCPVGVCNTMTPVTPMPFTPITVTVNKPSVTIPGAITTPTFTPGTPMVQPPVVPPVITPPLPPVLPPPIVPPVTPTTPTGPTTPVIPPTTEPPTTPPVVTPTEPAGNPSPTNFSKNVMIYSTYPDRGIVDDNFNPTSVSNFINNGYYYNNANSTPRMINVTMTKYDTTYGNEFRVPFPGFFGSDGSNPMDSNSRDILYYDQNYMPLYTSLIGGSFAMKITDFQNLTYIILNSRTRARGS